MSLPYQLIDHAQDYVVDDEVVKQLAKAIESGQTPTDYGFGYFDLSQAEARVVGWKARIGSWIEQFERARIEGGYDCHRALASQMWGLPYDSVPKEDRDENGNPTRRYIAKRCRHGLNYRMGPDRLATVTGLSYVDALSAYSIYHRITPELKRWWAAVEKEARENKLLINAYGRRLPIIGRIDEHALESIVAFYPQSTIGDKIGRVMYQMQEDDEWPIHARVILNIHDALIWCAPVQQLDRCKRIARKYAEEPIMIDGVPLIVPPDFARSVPSEAGPGRWSALKKEK
jgi:DNA polymerase I-like protein with 3'-5' exonuclease and polymerase domains